MHCWAGGGGKERAKERQITMSRIVCARVGRMPLAMKFVYALLKLVCRHAHKFPSNANKWPCIRLGEAQSLESFLLHFDDDDDDDYRLAE